MNLPIGSGSIINGPSTLSWTITENSSLSLGTVVSDYSYDNATLDEESSQTWEWSISNTSSGTQDFDAWDTLSVTSYYHDDVTTTFNATVQDSLTYNSWSESYSDETTGSSSSGGANNSVSFWGNGTDYSDSGWVVTDDSLSSGHSTLSSDGWSQVNSQYSGGNTSQYPASWDSHYSLSNDYSSGFQNSDDASASLAIAGGTSQSQLESFTDANTDETVTLSMNDLDGVLGYQGLGTEGNTTVASLSFSTSSDSSSTAGWNHSTSSTDSWNSSGDQLTDTLSYDGLGQSVSLHNLSIWTSVSNDESYHDDGGNTLSGSTTSVTDFWTHSEGSGTYSFGISTSPGVYSTWSSLWSNGDGQSSADFVSSDSGSIYGGWSDYSSGNDTWGSYDDEQSSGASTDGLGHSSTWSSTSQTLDGTESFGSHSETSTSLYGVVNDDTQDSSTQGRGTVTSVSDSSTTNGVSSLWVSTSYDGDAQWDGDNTDTYNATNTGGWNHSTSINDQWGSDDEVSSTTLSSGSAGNPVSASDSTLSEYSGESITTHGETSTSLSGGGSDTTTDFSSFNSGSLTSSSDSTLSNGLNSGWSSTSLDGNDNWTSDTSVSNNHAITGGWDHSTSSFDSWGSGGNLSTNYASSGGSGSPDNTISTSLTESSGDSTSLQDETSTALSGLSNDITSVSWISDTGSETLTNNSDSTSQDTLAFTSFGASGTRDLDWTDVQNSRTFSLSSLDDGNENYTHGYGSFYSYNDQSDLTAQTTGPYFSSVVSTSSDSTHTASGQDDTFADDQGSDTFSSMGYVGSTGTSTQDSGSEQFGFGQTYSDSYNDQTINHSSNDGHGHTSSSRAIAHSDQGSNGWSWNVDGSDTFGMTATDPSTGATSSDDGGENYNQGQTQTESFGDTSTSNSSTVNGSTTTLSTSTHTNGGTDTLSSGDQVGHVYGAVSFDPTTGDIASSTGSDNYDLGKDYSDTYTNLSIGATTTHSDSGFGGATYTDQGAETDLTTTTDPDTGDVSNDDNIDSYTEDDGSTESFTDQGWVTTGTTSNHLIDNTSLTTHTDNGSDSVSSYDQDTDISSDTSNNGLSTAGTSDTSTESDSSSDSYGDQSSQLETALGSSVTVINSTTYTDGGSDTDSMFDQGTDTSSDASADGLEVDSASDTYTNTESSSDSYTDQSFDFENVASGSVASASSSESSTDSGTDSTWSYDLGTNSETSASQDGLESDSGSDTYTDTESSSDSYGDQSYDGETESGGQPLSATGTDSHTDSGTDTSWSYDHGTDIPSSASEDGTESDSSSNTYTSTETSGDTSSDQSSDNETESGGSLVLATSSETSSDSETDTSSDIEYGSDTKETPTDSGAEVVISTYSETDTSSDAETDTSSDTADNQQGTTTETEDTTSDGSGMESSTETTSGIETFDGIEEDGSDYSGSGGFTENSFDSTTYTNHDDSDMTIDASGLLNGTDTSTGYDFETWNDINQDTDNISTSAEADDPVSLTDQVFGNTNNQENVVTTYAAGIQSEQGGSTLQTTETHSLSESDPLSSYGDVATDNATETIPAGGEGTATLTGGSPSGTLSRGFAVYASSTGNPSAPTSTDTQTNTPQGASTQALTAAGQLIASQAVDRTFGPAALKARSFINSLNGWAARQWQSAGDEWNALGGTLASLPGELLEKGNSGALISSTAGSADKIVNWWTFGYWTRSGRAFGPQYGQVDAYYQGAGVGTVTVYALNVASVTKTAASAIGGIRTIQTAGGLIRMGQMLAVATNGSKVSVNVIILQSGEAILATPATLEALGASAATIQSLSSDPQRLQQLFSTDANAASGAAKVWTTSARINAAQLPTSGRVRYIPPKGYSPGTPLPRGPNNGYIDRFGNEWVKGPSRTPGQPFEWDVQLGRGATDGIRWASPDGKHLNVSLDGEVTH